ncbi:hypothetical protein [Paracoccus ravus]|uniref:hypothetical protein n=1 Tax=Paracoccus ravus TaxID=2447760 RepID=UPI0014300710|nr:hypothetical protein [Paracoccus ravus]
MTVFRPLALVAASGLAREAADPEALRLTLALHLGSALTFFFYGFARGWCMGFSVWPQ